MIVGFDISTTRIDWAWISQIDGRPKYNTLHLGKPNTPLIDRIRNIRGLGLPLDVTDAVIEQPFSINRNSNSSLMAVVGALTCRLDRSITVAWVSPGDLRAAVGAKNTKASAQDVVHRLICPQYPGQAPDRCRLEGWSEHSLDALVACLGWTRILDQQDQHE